MPGWSGFPSEPSNQGGANSRTSPCERLRRAPESNRAVASYQRERCVRWRPQSSSPAISLAAAFSRDSPARAQISPEWGDYRRGNRTKSAAFTRLLTLRPDCKMPAGVHAPGFLLFSMIEQRLYIVCSAIEPARAGRDQCSNGGGKVVVRTFRRRRGGKASQSLPTSGQAVTTEETRARHSLRERESFRRETQSSKAGRAGLPGRRRFPAASGFSCFHRIFGSSSLRARKGGGHAQRRSFWFQSAGSNPDRSARVIGAFMP